MKKLAVICISILALCCSAIGQQKPKPKPQPMSASAVFDRQISSLERQFVPLVEAMPEDKFNFAPTNGEFKTVRDFAAMVKHVAVTNQLIAAAMLEEKPPKLSEEESDNGPSGLKSKAEIVQYLKDSFRNLHRAADKVTEKNLMTPVQNPFGGGKATRFGLSISVVGHSFDHYGQLVEYLRDNGIIPPASRPQK